MKRAFTEADIQHLFERLQKIVENCNGLPEMTFRIRVEQWLHTFFETRFDINLTTYGLHDYGELGTIKLEGAPDAIYGKLIIDYKAVGELIDKTARQGIIQEFCTKYLDAIPPHLRKFFRGVLFDGRKFVFIDWNEEKQQRSVVVEDFTKQSLHKWLEWLRESLGKNPSAQLLSQAFSLERGYTKSFIHVLYNKLKTELQNKKTPTAAHFEHWHDTFMFLYGSVLSGKKIKKDFAEVAEDLLITEPDPAPFLFVLFTYYANIIALICAEVLCAGWQRPSISKQLSTSTDIRSELEHVLRGDFFRQNFNLSNYIEDLYDFFWFLDAWDKPIEEAIEPLIKKIREFDFLVIAGLTSRDVLKGLYEKIVPQQIRHDLGEIFTPDWLVELALNEAGYEGYIEHTLLDPGCGRGVFLAEAISRIMKTNRDKLDDEELLQKILHNVVGFDINPIGVLTARANYLIALSPLLPTICELEHPLVIPVFMTDSILTPTTEDVEAGSDAYKISTSSGVLKLPRFFVDEENLNRTASLLRQLSSCTGQDEDTVVDTITKEFPYAPSQDIEGFCKFYERLSKLSRHEYNAIVTGIESFFAPLKYLHFFDFVVGNPPWIKWEFLAEEYKKKLGVLYLKVYKLFTHGGMKAAIGYAHDDISIVFTYVALDKYLKLGGKLAFLLKQTLYKSLAGKEFRKFCVDKVTGKVPLKVLKVHDLVKISPFPYTQSETSVIIVEKGAQTTYPVPYFVWGMKNGKSPSEISDDDNLAKVLKLVNIPENDAYPDPSLNESTAPWVVVPKGETPPRLPFGRNPYEVRHGIVDDLDQVFQVNIHGRTSTGLLHIENALRGKRKVKQVIREIEPDLVYPLLKPAYVKRWRIIGYDYVILPQRKYGEDNEHELNVNYSCTYRYLLEFKPELEKRASRWFKGRPFYTVFGLGEYTFKPYKVVWSAIGYLPDFAVANSVDDDHVGRKVLIPDNTIGYIPLDLADEAHFLCALLNSSYIKSIIAHKSTKSKWGLSVELVKQLPLPQFNPENTDHKTLCNLAKEANKLTNKQDKDELLKVEVEIDALSEKIIGTSSKYV